MRYLIFSSLVFLLQLSFLKAQGGLNQKSPILPSTGTQITVKSAFSSLGSWGHYPVNITLRNDSEIDSTFSLEANSESSAPYYRGSGQIELSSNFSLSCPAGSEKSFDLLIPIATASYGSYDYFHGSRQEIKENSLYLNFKSNKDEWSATILGEYSLAEKSKVYSDTILSKKTASSIGSSRGIYNFLAPSLLPVSQQGMYGYDQLFISEADWDKLSSSGKECLLHWNQLGGQLAVITDSNIIELANSLQKELESSPPVKKGAFFLLNTQHGDIWVGTTKNLNALESRINASENQKLMLSDLKNGFDGKKGQKLEWPVHEQLGIKKFDTIIIAFLLILFTILVGPINFFLLAKPGKRHRLFFTTPLISFGMCLLFVGYIVLKDGFGGSGYSVQLKEVDQSSNNSFIIQEQVCRTGMLFGSTFDLDNDLTIVQIPIEGSRWARVSNKKSSVNENYSVSRGESTTSYSGNHYSSRSEHGHVIVGNQITQESIEVDRTGNELELTSTFAETIDTIYVNLGGELFVAKNLTTGNTVTTEQATEADWRNWRQEKQSMFSKRVGKIFNKFASRENSYIAFASNSRAIETNTSIAWQSSTVITGQLNSNSSN